MSKFFCEIDTETMPTSPKGQAKEIANTLRRTSRRIEAMAKAVEENGNWESKEIPLYDNLGNVVGRGAFDFANMIRISWEKRMRI